MASPLAIILEDDATMSAAMLSFLKKKGIEALATARPEEANNWLREHRVKLLIVDCLLPGESGVDFVQSIRKSFPAPVLDVILTSGIFVEPNFIKESLRTTQAVAFLKKPFDLDVLNQHLGTLTVAIEPVSPRKLLYQSFGALSPSARERRRMIETLEELYGFDLPFMYSYLHHSGISGHLNVVDGKGQVFGITFANGAIVGVDLADSDTFLGRMLIEGGYVLPDDLNQTLNERNPKRIGERLIANQLLSPHAFELVLAHQMSIRLSRTIVDEQVKINFVSSEVEETTPQVDRGMLLRYIHDWIASKVTVDWLKANFTPWGNSTFIKGPEFRLDHPCFSWPLIANLENFVDNVLNDIKVSDLIEGRKYQEEHLLKGLHVLMCAGIIVLYDKPQMRSFEEHQRHLRNVQQQFHGKNPVEIYELMVRMTTASEQNPSQVYQEFVTLLGVPPTDRSLALMYADVRKAAEGAYEAVKSGSHLKIKDELAKQEVERKLRASNLFEQAKGQLEKAQYAQALVTLEKVERLDPKLDKLKLYMVWAKLGMIDSQANRAQAFKIIDADLMHVAPEDKFDSLYLFVMGLYFKAKGEAAQAKRHFERAIAIDGSFIAARRELTMITAANKQKVDVFNQDLKTLVGNLFQRRK